MPSIYDVAGKLGLNPEDLEPYGSDKAKIGLERQERGRPPGRLVLVSAITPTPAGEGKTTTTIGLGQAFDRLGESVCLALREPSLGPCFGVKGGGTGGGRSHLVPSTDINLHFTGDMHAVTSANNLLAAMIDNHLMFRLKPRLHAQRVRWRRVLDLNDRALRNVTLGLGGAKHGQPRESGFDITAASEIMAMLCLSEGLDDLRERIGRTLIGFEEARGPVTAGDIGATGPVLALLKDALKPNLVQTVEGTPALVHGGPFANIAHGCNSVAATRMAMGLADWTITEAGFGFDLGGEKFFDIKCIGAGLNTAAVVLVATVRALKMHGGVGLKNLKAPDPEAVRRGLCNLAKHVENVQAFGQVPIVAVNQFAEDVAEEHAVIQDWCASVGVPSAVTNHFAHGGEGAVELAKILLAHARSENPPLVGMYEWADPVDAKIRAVAQRVYGADGVNFTKQAEADLRRIDHLGYSRLPICIAKTQNSLSDDPHLRGRPSGFQVEIRELRVNSGAGFIVVLTGDIVRMPGLPRRPQAMDVDVVDGEIVGIS